MKEQAVSVHEKHSLQIAAARVSIIGSVISFLISASVGLAADSITLLLDSSLSLVILLVALLTNFSLKRTYRPDDEHYHFGYTKFEPMTVAVQGVLIITTCAVSIKFAVQDIIHAETLHSWELPLAAAFCSGVLGLGISAFLHGVAGKTHSMMLKGSARHWLADAVMSFGIFAGFLLGFVSEQYGYGFLAPYVDPAMAIALALFFMCTPIKSIISNMRELLDAAPKPEHSTARQIIEQAGLGQLKLDKLRARKGGDKVFLQAYFSVHPGMTVSESHECAGKIEEQLRRHFENCEVSVLFKPAH